MPKYVFETSLYLPSGYELSGTEARSIAASLEREVERQAHRFGHVELKTNAEEPFEQVTGDWLPPDEHGQVKVGPSRPIDL